MAWSDPLARKLTLERRGKTIELVTLRDAADWIMENFQNVIRDIALEEAAKDLLRAAKSGKKADLERATKQIEVVARFHRWL